MIKTVLQEKWVRWTVAIAIVIVSGLFLYGKGYNDKRDEVVDALSNIGKPAKNINNTTDDVDEKKFTDLGTVSMGEIAKYGNVNFKVTGAKICKSIKSFGPEDKPQLGQYIVVDLEGENVGTSVEDLYSGHMRLADNNGHDYGMDISSSVAVQKKQHSMWGDSFNPGGKKNFRLAFDVPEGELSEYKIQIQFSDGVQYMALA